MFCSVCRTSLRPGAQFCHRCGARVPPTEPEPPPAAPVPTYTPPAPPPQYVYVPTPTPVAVQVPVQRRRSTGFAWTTLAFLIFLYPVGLVLTLIGLCTGPRRGCFVWLLILGFVIPVFVFGSGIHTGNSQLDQRLEEIRRNFSHHPRETPERDGWPSDRGRDRR